MKWFKHIADSLDDPFVSELIETFGSDGYLVFFGTLEIIAREFKTGGPEELTVSCGHLTRKLQLSRQKVIKILKHCSEKGRILFSIVDNSILLQCPKFHDLMDDYTHKRVRKGVRTKDGECPENVRVEVEVEKEDTPCKPPTGGGTKKYVSMSVKDAERLAYWKRVSIFPERKAEALAAIDELNEKYEEVVS